jgi:raffinose/stachyose/melibiose transport system substrate-binding protein
VRLYVCDDTLLEVYQKLATDYYDATGVAVILLTPGEGESCQEALERYMASEAQPTMFCLHQEQSLQQYAHLLYDLTDTQAAGQLYSSGFGMHYGEKLLALPVAVEWFGYIYNAELLGKAFTREDFYRKDITGYNSMAYIAQHLTSIKLSPFGKPDLADTSAAGLAALLSTVFQNPEQLRSFVDLYVSNSQVAGDPLTAFKNGKSVFYAGTTADFAEALSLGIENVDLLPAFAKGSNAMQYTCASFLAVKSTGYDPDIQVTLAFLRWLVTARQGGGAPIDELGLLSPYKSATVAHNALEKLLRKYMAEEPARVAWAADGLTGEEMKDFCAALAAYCANPSDAAWDKVAQILEKKPATPPEA